MEIWKDIKGYEGLYQISNMGRVKVLKRTVFKTGKKPFVQKEKIRKGVIDSCGYIRVRLYATGMNKNFSLQRLVATHFLPNSENKSTVNHKNGIKTDNTVENLEWMTRSENVRHSFDNGFNNPRIGILNGCAKLNDEKVIAIKLKYKRDGLKYRRDGITMKKLAKEYNVDYTLIHKIITGKSWSHINI